MPARLLAFSPAHTPAALPPPSNFQLPTATQLEPKDLAEQLKKTGAAIPSIRPGKQTAEYITRTLTNMSALGSVFLGALSVAPAAVEALTHLTAFRGFAGTSVLIMVGAGAGAGARGEGGACMHA